MTHFKRYGTFSVLIFCCFSCFWACFSICLFWACFFRFTCLFLKKNLASLVFTVLFRTHADMLLDADCSMFSNTLLYIKSMKEIQNFINGCFVAPQSGKYIDSINPATGEVHAKIPSSNDADTNNAVHSAKSAFQHWSNQTTQFRSTMLLKIADILESRLDEFAQLESQDQGKPVWLARMVDIPRAVYNFRFFATYILHHVEDSSLLQKPAQALNYIQRVPLGVAGLISPWNLPMYLLTWKIAPAIAFGNTCVAKPSELTSVTAFKFCEVLKDAGLPAGVVNMVFGYGPSVGEAIVKHPDIPLVSFTGSTAVGNRITEVSAPFCKKLSLELGGKNAAVIFDDADFDDCVATTIRSSFTNQGEICLCTSRIYVQSKIFDKFVNRFVELARAIKVGDPTDPDVKMGALVSQQHYEKVIKYIGIAREEGGVFRCGHGVDELSLPEKCKNGYFVLPTVITGLKDTSPCFKEEIFGPVVCISPFETEEEAIRRANDVQYGLSATLWSKDVSRIHRVADKLQAGTVWVNCWMVRDLNMPFGGVKMSGVGREGGKYSQDFFTEAKTVCIKY